jgi:hypothetical protein
MNYPGTNFNYELWSSANSTAAPPPDVRSLSANFPTAPPPDVRSLSANFPTAPPPDVRSLSANFPTAPPPDVRQGYALPFSLSESWGCAPGPGFAPTIWAVGRTKGTAQLLIRTSRRGIASPHIRRRSRNTNAAAQIDIRRRSRKGKLHDSE